MDDAALKVAFLVYRFPVVSETFVIEQAAALVARGIDLRILAVQPGIPGDGPAHPEVAAANLLARTLRPSTPAPGTLIRQSGRAVRLARLAPHPRTLWRTLGEAQMLDAAPAFDVVHCQFATLGLNALRHRALGSLRTRALVVHLRGSDITSFVTEHGPQVYARLFAVADLFIANCGFFRDRAVALGCPPEKIVVIGSPIDTTQFALRPPRPVNGGPVRLVCVGRLVPKKGVADLVAAMAILRDRGVAADLTIVGDGPLLGDLRDGTERHRLADRIRFAGAQARDGVLAALHAADIALAPSVTAPDGDQDAPVNTLKEAMAIGLPVIATRHGGIPELVIDGENGCLVAERAPGEIADAVERLAAMRDRWADMGAAGRARVIADYDRPGVIDRTLAAYHRALVPH